MLVVVLPSRLCEQASPQKQTSAITPFAKIPMIIKMRSNILNILNFTKKILAILYTLNMGLLFL